MHIYANSIYHKYFYFAAFPAARRADRILRQRWPQADNTTWSSAWAALGKPGGGVPVITWNRAIDDKERQVALMSYWWHRTRVLSALVRQALSIFRLGSP